MMGYGPWTVIDRVVARSLFLSLSEDPMVFDGDRIGVCFDFLIFDF